MPKVSLFQPIFSEKTLMLAQSRNQYSFFVGKSDTKHTIKEAVEKAFGVHVEGVQVVNVAGQDKRRGKKRLVVRGRDQKKAIVKLREKEKIDLFDTEEKKGRKGKTK